MMHEARSGFSREQVDDNTLSQRIRSTMGRFVDDSGAINVQCIQGWVTLHGPVPASQLNRLLRGVRGVRGVSGIDNQLDVRAQPGSVGRDNSFTRGGSRPRASAPLSPPGTTTN